MNDFDIFIPSYHRADNLKTVRYYVEKVNWNPKKIHVFIDSEAEDGEKYEKVCSLYGVNLHVFDMEEARKRYDYVHRASMSRRSAGQARNMFFDYAKENGINFYMVQDDDTNSYQIRTRKGYKCVAGPKAVKNIFYAVKGFMEKHQIGLFGLSQTGDIIGGNKKLKEKVLKEKVLRKKVMNTTFYLLPYVYRGERGVQDDDTSLFVGVMNEGLFTGSWRYGLILQQTPSATAKGGLTDLYNECKLLNKSLVVPIQFPSLCRAEKQVNNGGRLHHKINYRFLMPCILKNKGGRSNIEWNTYPEDTPFTNEPKRKYVLNS